ncbi:MAG TPA: DAK2 domain-containing protein [Actinotalea sp.]
MSEHAGAAALDGATLRCWMSTAHDLLTARRDDLDALNVFPVADADTGTNLLLTLGEAASAVGRLDGAARAGDVAQALVRGALIGARGNSGVIVGQYLRAFVGGLPTTMSGTALTGTTTGHDLADALERAAVAAYEAVGEPLEGTVLTVARAVGAGARRATRATPGAGCVEVLDAGVDVGYQALARTTGQLPALRAAGVLDAGGWGLLLVLDALAHCLGSTSALDRAAVARRAGTPDGRPVTSSPTARAAMTLPPCPEPSGDGGGAPIETGPEFEVMYLVEDGSGSDLAPRLRSALRGVGESVAVVGGEGLWQVHVHTSTPLEALAGASAVGGAARQVRVRHLMSQSGVHGQHRPALGLVAVTAAPGLVADLARAGAVVVLVHDGDHLGPQLRRAVQDTGASRVLVLASQQVDPALHDGDVEVVDDLQEVQLVIGAATLASQDPSPGPDALLAEVTRAVRQVRTSVVSFDAADVGGVLHAERVRRTVDRLLESATGIVTVVTGTLTPPAAVAALLDAGRSHEEVELVVLAGGAPHADVVIGVE